MMHQAAIELGVTCRVLAGEPNSSAAQVTGQVELGDYRNWDDVLRVSQGTQAVTFDHEHVPNEFLDELITNGVNVQPQPTALIHAQDKLVMRKRLREMGAPVPPFMGIETVEDAQEFWRATNGAVCLKARRGGYDGKGVWFPDSEEATASLVADLLEQGVPLMAEKKVTLVRELSAMVARRPSGQTVAWPVVESVQEQGICVEAIAPAANPGRASELAIAIAEELGVTGALAVELFETLDETGQPEIIVNELAMRPHNTGHWTQDGCETSQFEQHIRAVLDRPLGSTAMRAPVTVMANVLGADVEPEIDINSRMDAVWERFPNAKIHMYGKDWRPRRKMGHVNLTGGAGEDVETVRRNAKLCANYVVTGQWADGVPS